MLPDITVLGPYTYLATEVLFGSVAAALLYRAAALRRAARTIAVLYPVAYVWDWYTLEVGVFAIPMRTGVDLLGIPLEEHLFIVVVPAFVLGIHETLHGRHREAAVPAGDDAGRRGTTAGDDAGRRDARAGDDAGRGGTTAGDDAGRGGARAGDDAGRRDARAGHDAGERGDDGPASDRDSPNRSGG